MKCNGELFLQDISLESHLLNTDTLVTLALEDFRVSKFLIHLIMCCVIILHHSGFLSKISFSTKRSLSARLIISSKKISSSFDKSIFHKARLIDINYIQYLFLTQTTCV